MVLMSTESQTLSYNTTQTGMDMRPGTTLNMQQHDILPNTRRIEHNRISDSSKTKKRQHINKTDLRKNDRDTKE